MYPVTIAPHFVWRLGLIEFSHSSDKTVPIQVELSLSEHNQPHYGDTQNDTKYHGLG